MPKDSKGCSDERVEKTSTSNTAGDLPLDLAESTCGLSITRRSLLEYLYHLKSDMVPDAALTEHFSSGCKACQDVIENLYLTDVYLRDGVDRSIAILVERVPERPVNEQSTEPERLALADQVSRSLAKLVTRPHQHPSLEDILKQDEALRKIDPAQRGAEVACLEERYEISYSLADPSLKREVERCAEHILSELVRGDQDEIFDVSSILADPNSQAVFLAYLMAGRWFMNASGDRLWQIRDNHLLINVKALREHLSNVA